MWPSSREIRWRRRTFQYLPGTFDDIRDKPRLSSGVNNGRHLLSDHCAKSKELLGWFGAAASTAPEPMARAATTSDSFNAVAEPSRREILNYLALQERAVGEITVGLNTEQP